MIMLHDANHGEDQLINPDNVTLIKKTRDGGTVVNFVNDRQPVFVRETPLEIHQLWKESLE